MGSNKISGAALDTLHENLAALDSIAWAEEKIAALKGKRNTDRKLTEIAGLNAYIRHNQKFIKGHEVASSGVAPWTEQIIIVTFDEGTR